MSRSYNTLIPEAFTSQFPYSYQDQEQRRYQPFNYSMTPPPTFQNPSTTGDNIIEDGSVGIENGPDLSKDGLQGEKILLMLIQVGMEQMVILLLSRFNPLQASLQHIMVFDPSSTHLRHRKTIHH